MNFLLNIETGGAGANAKTHFAWGFDLFVLLPSGLLGLRLNLSRQGVGWGLICLYFYTMVWNGMVWCGAVRWGGVGRGVVLCCVVWCGVVWCGVVWCGVVWCGAVRCGAPCCGILEHSIR